MPQELLNIVLSAVSIVITGLASWGVSVFINWMNSKIKDQKLADYLTSITQIVTDAVMNVFQSFVETLKANGKFDEKAQAEAKQKAIDIIMTQLTPELKEYITTNFGDMKEWVSNKIESVIYGLKATNKISVKKTEQ